MSAEFNEEELRAQVIQDRTSLGLTVDQLFEKYPMLSRSKIGRWVKGVQKGIVSQMPLEAPNGELEPQHETTEIGQSDITPPNHHIEPPMENPHGSVENPITEGEIARANPIFEGEQTSRLPLPQKFQRAPQPQPQPQPQAYGQNPAPQYLDLDIFVEAMRMAQARGKTKEDKAFIDDVFNLALKKQAVRPVGNPSSNAYRGYSYQAPANPYLERAWQMREAQMVMGGGNSDSKEITELKHQIERLSDKLERKSESNTILESLKTGVELARQNQPQASSLQDMLTQIKTTLTFMEGLQHQRGLSPEQLVEIEKTKVIYENVGKGLENLIKFGMDYFGGRVPQHLLDRVKHAKNANVSTFTCEGCKNELSVPIPANAPDKLNVKCPKCGKITELSAKPTEEAKPQEQPPKEEKPTRTRLRPTYR